MSSAGICQFPSEKDQNGESHPMTDLKTTQKDYLSLPTRSNKYRESQTIFETKPPMSSGFPLEASDVQVQLRKKSKCAQRSKQIRKPRATGLHAWWSQAGADTHHNLCPVMFRATVSKEVVPVCHFWALWHSWES
ncbi:UNVERIFIED_CONTAM: hypothetical protein K2H54_049187 [Gekko kuhli]